MNARPKYVAVVDFSCAGDRFAAGDPVPESVALATALRHGARFVTTARSKRPKSTPTNHVDDVDNPDTEE